MSEVKICKYCKELTATKRIQFPFRSKKYPDGKVRMCIVCALMLVNPEIKMDLNRLKMANDYSRSGEWHEEIKKRWRKGRPKWEKIIDGSR